MTKKTTKKELKYTNCIFCFEKDVYQLNDIVHITYKPLTGTKTKVRYIIGRLTDINASDTSGMVLDLDTSDKYMSRKEFVEVEDIIKMKPMEV